MPGFGRSLQPVEAAGVDPCRGVPLPGRPSAAFACLARRPRVSLAGWRPCRRHPLLAISFHSSAPPRAAARLYLGCR
eukprot:15388079-Alexandrium_andersonii.AAC.1